MTNKNGMIRHGVDVSHHTGTALRVGQKYSSAGGLATDAGVTAYAMTTHADAGAVGIGVTAPSMRLHVADSGFELARFQSTGTNTDCRINLEGNGTGGGAVNSINNFLSLQVGGSERARITSNGTYLFGLSVSADTTTPVQSSTSGQFSSGLRVYASTHATSERAGAELGEWVFGQDGSGNGTKDFFLYQGGTATATRAIISTSGNVTIGNVAPASKLHVDGDVTLTNATTATAATAGTRTLPANPVDFLVVSINGTSCKIPYYAT
jgi:hypothetical protein